MLRVSTDKSELDISLIYGFLSEQSTWARGIPRALVERAMENSLCFGGFTSPLNPQSLMERYSPGIHQSDSAP